MLPVVKTTFFLYYFTNCKTKNHKKNQKCCTIKQVFHQTRPYTDWRSNNSFQKWIDFKGGKFGYLWKFQNFGTVGTYDKLHRLQVQKVNSIYDYFYRSLQRHFFYQKKNTSQNQGRFPDGQNPIISDYRMASNRFDVHTGVLVGCSTGVHSERLTKWNTRSLITRKIVMNHILWVRNYYMKCFKNKFLELW